MKIIIAEDDPCSNHFLKRTLEYWGHSIQAVPDGNEAWAAMEKNGIPDMIISDWEMPNLTGIDLCRKVRTNPAMNDVYIILLTAKSHKNDMYNGFKMGADDYIAKPVSEKDLRDSIARGEDYLKGRMMDREDLRQKNMSNFILRHQ